MLILPICQSEMWIDFFKTLVDLPKNAHFSFYNSLVGAGNFHCSCVAKGQTLLMNPGWLSWQIGSIRAGSKAILVTPKPRSPLPQPRRCTWHRWIKKVKTCPLLLVLKAGQRPKFACGIKYVKPAKPLQLSFPSLLFLLALKFANCSQCIL